jgi:hypothetical protein
MHPLANLTLATGAIVLFLSAVLIVTGAELPIGEPSYSDDSATTFAFQGFNGTLSFNDSGDLTNIGWAAFVFGDYVDLDEDGMWDSCRQLELFVWAEGTEKPADINHENNTFHPLCEAEFERTELVDQSLVYAGQVCHHTVNNSLSKCSSGNYTFESNIYVKLVEEHEDVPEPFFSSLIELVIGGARTGYASMCCSLLILVLGTVLGLVMKEDEGTAAVNDRSGPKAEWRAYSLTQSERGTDGLPKSFSRHLLARTTKRKPKKGNIRGGVHKGGGLYLGGWTEEDSDKAYKSKVEEKRDE